MFRHLPKADYIVCLYLTVRPKECLLFYERHFYVGDSAVSEDVGIVSDYLVRRSANPMTPMMETKNIFRANSGPFQYGTDRKV